MSTHVPAWKRLGLKLKYAKDNLDSTSTAITTNVHDHDDLVSERPVKRRRIVSNNTVASPEQNGPPSSSDNTAQLRSSKKISTTNGSAQAPETSAGSLNQSIQRKKSVTFSEETKQDDGDSRTTIDFPAGSPGSTPKKTKKLSKAESSESPTTTTTNNDVNLETTNHDTTPTKKQSKPKTGKKSKQSKTSAKDKSSSALDYLTQHRSARDSWKFNKILDVWILNHALDAQAIPSTHVPSLAGYVRGLPAKAGSRDRLTKECREALSSSQADEDINDADRSLFIHFVESQDGPLGDTTRLEEFLKAHSRAAVLLWSLDETVSGLSNGTPSSAVKKKKSRTSAPIDISSSSESDSDSDSSDDSSESEGETTMKTTTNGLASKDDTSSSGTSSPEDEDDTSSSEESSDSSSDDEDED